VLAETPVTDFPTSPKAIFPTLQSDYDLVIFKLTKKQCGDCNQDGSITILDALVAAQIGVGLVTAEGEALEICDVDGSGDVSILDALLLSRFLAGLVPALMCN